MNRTEHKIRMCFDPEYSHSYDYFLSRKNNILKIYYGIFKDEASTGFIASLIVILLGNFGIFIASLVLRVPLKLLTFLRFSDFVLIVYVLILSVMSLYLFISCTLHTREAYRNVMYKYENK